MEQSKIRKQKSRCYKQYLQSDKFDYMSARYKRRCVKKYHLLANQELNMKKCETSNIQDDLLTQRQEDFNDCCVINTIENLNTKQSFLPDVVTNEAQFNKEKNEILATSAVQDSEVHAVHKPSDLNGDDGAINIESNYEQVKNELNNVQKIMFTESGLSQLDVLTMVYSLTLRHQLTNIARKDIIELLKVCANVQDEYIESSNYYISKLFDPSDTILKYFFYCEHCKTLLREPIKKNEIKQQETAVCPNVQCSSKQLISPNNKNFFILVDIESQIKALLSNESILKSLLNKEKNGNISISDVQDGELYKNLQRKCTFDLTYNFNTDGAPLFGSSKRTMWPIQLMINELLPKDRFRKVLFAGIWVGRGEPNTHLMNTIIRAFSIEAKKLYSQGITIIQGEQKLNFKLLPFLCTVDSVARPVIQNRFQFNGRFGCSWCYHNGTTINKQIKYPMQEVSPDVRTAERYRDDLKQVIALQYKEPVNGIKGPSSIIHLPNFDPIWGMPPDYMHGVLLGVVRQLWDLWTTYNPENKHTFYIGSPRNLKNINERLMCIKPPHEIHRLPRPISEKSKWKASEWRSWLLFYSLPCLDGILNTKYLKHFSLLVKSIHTLLKESISHSDLSEADSNLTKFVKKSENLYGKNVMTFNMHSLLHLGESVKKTGPLWCSSTFPFESKIHFIKQQVNGPVGVSQQICKKMYNMNTILINISNNNMLSDNAKIFSTNLYFQEKMRYVTKAKDQLILFGNGNLLPTCELNILLSKVGTFEHDEYFENCSSIFSYKRCLYKNNLLHSSDYKKAKKNNDTIILVHTGEFLRIIKFLSSNSEIFIYAQKIHTERYNCGNVQLNHMFKIINESNDYVLIKFSDIKEKCILVETGKNEFVCKFANTFEIH